MRLLKTDALGRDDRAGRAWPGPGPRPQPSDCQSCPARGDGLCSSRDVVTTVARHRSGNRKVEAGRDIFSAGEPCDVVYNLVGGWAILYSVQENGRRQILHFALPGAVLGFLPARGAMATHGIQALTDAVVCIIPRAAFDRMLKDHAEVGMRVAWLMSRDRSLAFDRLASIGRQSARERVAHLLLELFIRYRTRWPGNRIEEMHLPLTQEHIGDATGLTFVHVNRVLRDLRRDGIAEFHYGRLRILDPDKLVDVAGIDPQLVLSWTERPPAD